MEPLIPLGTGKISLFRVSGCSMMPLLEPGDVLITEKAPWSALIPGALVVYQNDGLIVHRLFRIRKQNGNIRFFSQGDNRTSADLSWETKDYVGKVRCVYKRNEHSFIVLFPESGSQKLLGRVFQLEQAAKELLRLWKTAVLGPTPIPLQDVIHRILHVPAHLFLRFFSPPRRKNPPIKLPDTVLK